MSADTVLPPLQARPDVPTDIAGLVRHCVDVYDAAAHLEASGFGDSFARRAGVGDSFEHARLLLAGRPPVGTDVHEGPRPQECSLEPALYRVLVMISGVVICLVTLPPGSPAWLFFLAGAAGWLGGQSVSAATWRGLGTGSRTVAARNARDAIVVAALCGAALALVTGEVAILLWIGWSISAAVLVILSNSRALALAVAVAAAGVGAAAVMGGHQAGLYAATAAVVVAAARAAAVLARERIAAHRSRGCWASMGWAVIQTAGQLCVLGTILAVVGSTAFAAVAIAGLAAGAVTDPVIELAHQRVRRAVAKPASWARGRRRTATIGILAVIAALTVPALVMLVGLIGFGTVGSPYLVLGGTLLVAALTAATGMQLRAGSAPAAARTSVAMAALTAGTPYIAAVGLMPIDAVLALIAGTAVIAATVTAARVLSRPELW